MTHRMLHHVLAHPLGAFTLSATVLAFVMLGRDMWKRITAFWYEVNAGRPRHAGA